MKKLLTAIILFLFVFQLVASAIDENYYFKKIDINEGLSQSTVFNILQDRKGFLWFGTADGLNRYDGYNFKVFVNNPLDSSSISGNGISALYEDKQANIWIGTTEGILNKFDRSTETFQKYYITDYRVENSFQDNKYFEYPIPFSRNNSKTITAIEEDKNGNLWIGTWNKGLIRFEKSTKKHNYFLHSKKANSISSNKIMDIIVDHNGIIWVGTFGSGIDRLNYNDEKNFSFFNYSSLNKGEYKLENDEVIKLFLDKEFTIWIGTYGGGVSQFEYYNMEKPLFSKIDLSEDKSNFSGSDTVMDIIQDKTGYLWFGTFGGGITRFNKTKGRCEKFEYSPNIENSLVDNDVISLFEDSSGIIWIGTHLGKGLLKLEKNTVKFKSIKYDPTSKFSLSDNVVWAIYEDGNILWVGTYRQGLLKYDLNKGLIKTYKYNPNNSKSINDDHIRSIEKDKFGNLIIGSYKGGLNIFNPETEEAIIYKYDFNNKFSISSNQIQDILLRNDTLWLATFGGGLCFSTNYSKEYLRNLKFQSLKNIPGDPSTLSDNRTYKLFYDKNNIWVGTFGGGLNKYSLAEKIFYRYQNKPNQNYSLSDERVISINRLNDTSFFIGTYGGNLNEFNPENTKFRRFNERTGITSHVIYGIIIDKRKMVWFSTDAGLFKYDSQTKNTIHYDIQDGLQSLEFSGGAYFQSDKGRIYFGGVNGINYFHPDSISVNTFIPPIVITSFKIFNNEQKGEKENITLTYEQNFFSFEFSSLDYTNPSENMYAYILEGFDKDWRKTTAKHRIAHYTNLSPGNYQFRVIGSNDDGYWNNEGVVINLTILPPFWQTFWFLTIVTIIAAGFIFYVSTLRYRNLLAIEKVKSKLAADLHDNVGSGLTEISILTELAAAEAKNASNNSSSRLKNISEIARLLIDNMSDIVWVINPKRDSLHDLIVRLKDFYSDFLSQTGVAFKTINIEKIKNIKLPMDYKQNLYLILKEAINNSIKHSNCKKIELKINLRSDFLELTIKDDGQGFDSTSPSHGNGLINMNERAAKIGGKIKLSSNNEKGTAITFIGKISKFDKLKAKFQV